MMYLSIKATSNPDRIISESSSNVLGLLLDI